MIGAMYRWLREWCSRYSTPPLVDPNSLFRRDDKWASQMGQFHSLYPDRIPCYCAHCANEHRGCKFYFRRTSDGLFRCPICRQELSSELSFYAELLSQGP